MNYETISFQSVDSPTNQWIIWAVVCITLNLSRTCVHTEPVLSGKHWQQHEIKAEFCVFGRCEDTEQAHVDQSGVLTANLGSELQQRHICKHHSSHCRHDSRLKVNIFTQPCFVFLLEVSLTRRLRSSYFLSSFFWLMMERRFSLSSRPADVW